MYRISYIPSGTWCSWVDGTCYTGPTEIRVSGTDNPEGFTFIKAGTAVMTQKSAQTIEKTREQTVCTANVFNFYNYNYMII